MASSLEQRHHLPDTAVPGQVGTPTTVSLRETITTKKTRFSSVLLFTDRSLLDRVLSSRRSSSDGPKGVGELLKWGASKRLFKGKRQAISKEVSLW